MSWHFDVSTIRKRRRVPLSLTAALILGVTGAGHGQTPAEVTFARDVAPILQQNCQVCHQPGSIAPMSFMTYEEVRPWARIIRARVVEREMPPYHYDPGVGIQELKDDRRLTDREIETIVRWVEAGTPMGDPRDLPAPVQWPDAAEWRLAAELGPPDVIVDPIRTRSRHLGATSGGAR
jgi:hypothetical protein